MAVEHELQLPTEDSALSDLYRDFGERSLAALWTQRADLMPTAPSPSAIPHVWRWSEIFPLIERAGDLVPVGRGGERRAIALANPGLGGAPFATPTLWAALQYLTAKETAPRHRHTQAAFRFVLHGSGVWTAVNGDPISLTPGDVILTPARTWHEHRNGGEQPMVWLDGLDIPLVKMLDGEFFQPGPERPGDYACPPQSRSERLWGHPGLMPIGEARPANEMSSPLLVYRWAQTDRALDAQLEVQAESAQGGQAARRAAVRMVDPRTGGDSLPTMRLEMHRLLAGASIEAETSVGSSVWQVFSGGARVTLGGEEYSVGTGDIFSVPSWCPLTVRADQLTEVFMFSDAPVFEKLGLAGGLDNTPDPPGGGHA